MTLIPRDDKWVLKKKIYVHGVTFVTGSKNKIYVVYLRKLWKKKNKNEHETP